MYTENGEVVYIELSEYIILECIPILYKKDKLFKKTKINNGLEIYPIILGVFGKLLMIIKL